MSPSRRKALQYFAKLPNGASWLDENGPSRAMLRRMVAEGQLEVIHPPGGVGMIRWKLSAIGRARLGI